MHILLILEIAFSIWMLIDAFKRGVEFYWYFIILLPFGEWVYFFVFKINDFKSGGGFSPSGSGIKCSSCKHCINLYEDGVSCQPGNTQVFKTLVHISYCGDYRKK